MGGIKLDRRSLLATAPLVLAAIAAGEKAGTLGDIKVAPAPEAGPDPSQTLVQPYQGITFRNGATCRRTAAKWPCCTEISTIRGPIWC